MAGKMFVEVGVSCLRVSKDGSSWLTTSLSNRFPNTTIIAVETQNVPVSVGTLKVSVATPWRQWQ